MSTFQAVMGWAHAITFLWTIHLARKLDPLRSRHG